jgi:hypothetical protein
MDPGINEFPEQNVVQDNEFINNGTNPVAHPLAPYAADITYVAWAAYGNCFSGNEYTTREYAIAGPSWLLGNAKCI